MKLVFKHAEIQAAIAALANKITGLKYNLGSCKIEMSTEPYVSGQPQGYQATIEAEEPNPEAVVIASTDYKSQI